MPRTAAPSVQLLICLVCYCLVETPQLARADRISASWPQWRGPARDGRVANVVWPGSLEGDAIKVDWSIPLGPSYSGPIVAENRVFVTETEDEKWEVVRALDRETGAELWKTKWQGAISVPFFARSNGSWIRSTPAYDDGRLYVAGIRDVLVCLDAEAGKSIWRLDFVAELGSPTPSFGFVCSPLIVGDSVFVQAGASFVKVDKRTGKIRWRALEDDGGMWGSAFSSPTIAQIAGQMQLVVQTRTRLAGVDLETGKVLWSQEIPAFRGMNILTPTVLGDSVFTSSYGGKSLMFNVGRAGDGYRVDSRWENKSQGYMSSPVVVGNYAYLHLRNQRFTCIDLRSGETKWTSNPFGKYWSMVVNGDRILALDQRGELLLIRANPSEFELLDSREITDQETWAHLAICKDQIFVRELKSITKLTWADRNQSASKTSTGE